MLRIQSSYLNHKCITYMCKHTTVTFVMIVHSNLKWEGICTGDEIKIAGHNSLIVPEGMATFDGWDPCSMSTIMEEQDIPCFSLINHVTKCLLYICTSGQNHGPWCISQELDTSKIKSEPFHKHFLHCQHIIDASM